MDDEWRPITEAPSYLINRHGHVKNRYGKFVGVWFTMRGEVRIKLTLNDRSQGVFDVEELVENAFPEECT